MAVELHAFDASEGLDAVRLHALLTLAHAQEARWLPAGSIAPPPVTLDALRSRRQFCIGAFDGEALVGALCIAADDEPGQIQIATLVVHPGHQRMGIARRLMRDALQRGGTGLAFSVVTGAANQPALALYQGLGFLPYRHGLLDGSGIALVKLRRDPGLPLD